MNSDGKGYQLPAVVDPVGKICVCVPVPNDQNHIRAFLGQLDMLAKWYTWAKDEAHTGKDAAEIWRDVVAQVREAIDMDCGCGGGASIPTNQRYTEDGLLEVSYDGGVTWENGEAIDPRFNSPLFPPLDGSTEQQKCNTAYGAVQYLQDTIYSDLTTYTSAAQLLTFIASVLAILFTGGVATPLIVAAVGNLFAFGLSAVDAALTGAVWDDFGCLLYCRLEDDGTMTTENFIGLQADVNATFTGIVPQVLNDAVRMLGPVGLVNSGRSIRITSADCSGCECNECGVAACTHFTQSLVQAETLDAWSAPPNSTAPADGGTQAIRSGTQTMYFPSHTPRCVYVVRIRVRANSVATSDNPVFITVTVGDQVFNVAYRSQNPGAWVTRTLTLTSPQFIDHIDFVFGTGTQITTINWVNFDWCDSFS